MKNDEILTKAIEESKTRGFDCFGWKHFEVVMGGIGFWDYDDIDSFSEAKEKGEGHMVSDEGLLFDHDFDKAFFGPDKTQEEWGGCPECGTPTGGWEWNIVQLALIEKSKRIPYLEQFLERDHDNA